MMKRESGRDKRRNKRATAFHRSVDGRVRTGLSASDRARVARDQRSEGISAWFWSATFDFRVGGAFAFGPDGSDMVGIFDAIDPPRLIQFKGPSPATNPEGYLQFALR